MQPLTERRAALAKKRAVFLPHEKEKGDPFYIFMEVYENGNTTGAIHTTKLEGGRHSLLLFPSLGSIQRMEPFIRKVSDSYRIRGVSAALLEALIRISEQDHDLELVIVRTLDSVTGNILSQRADRDRIEKLAKAIREEEVLLLEPHPDIDDAAMSALVASWWEP